MEKFTVPQKVMFQQKIYFAPLDLMVWYSKNIPTFPLNEAQIRANYVHNETGRLRGMLPKRKHQTRGDVDQAELKEINDYFKSFEKTGENQPKEIIGKQQHRNTVIGYETGSDIAIGPGNVKDVFVD